MDSTLWVRSPAECLPQSLIIWVRFLGSTWEDRPDSSWLSSDLHSHATTCEHQPAPIHIYNDMANDVILKLKSTWKQMDGDI